MKITLSKSQWQFIGKQAGWQQHQMGGYKAVCPECGSDNAVIRKDDSGNLHGECHCGHKFTPSLKTAQQTAQQTAQGIATGFEGLAGGIKESGDKKAVEYAQRILKGEPRDAVLQGQGSVMISKVDAALAKLKGQNKATPPAQNPQLNSQQIIDWSRKGSPDLQKAVGRILSGNDPAQVDTLKKSVAGDPTARKWLAEYVQAMKAAI